MNRPDLNTSHLGGADDRTAGAREPENDYRESDEDPGEPEDHRHQSAQTGSGAGESEDDRRQPEEDSDEPGEDSRRRPVQVARAAGLDISNGQHGNDRG